MSTKVAIQKFSFPFSCAARLSQHDEATQPGCVQLKASGLRDLRENRILGDASPVAIIETVVQNEKRAQGGPEPPPGGVTAAARLLVGAGASQKLSVEGEDQRPVAKRQLSSESAARTVTAVKKSAVRKEGEEHGPPKPKERAPPLAAAGKRRRRKDLFTNSEVFNRVDSHVVRAGAEV